jgi:hypothetical protein
MKGILVNVLFVCVLHFWYPSVGVAADAQPYVPVASYLNTPELNKTVGKRAFQILRTQNIESIGTGNGLGGTISVPVDRVDEALRLLAKAIKEEKLNLHLLARKEGRYVGVTPESILEPKKAE